MRSLADSLDVPALGPPAARYGLALAAVALALLVRALLLDALGVKVPYLQFFPAVMVAAWYGGFGPGAAATGLSVLASMYFLHPPNGFAVGDDADVLSLVGFAAVGLAISWLNHLLLLAQHAHRGAVATANARAERLDAILNTTSDGIVVIDERGTIEAFNRGAQTLFGYPEAEVVGRNVSLLMPSPRHEQHDSYLARYLSTGTPHILGIGREVTARRRDGVLFPVDLSIGEMRVGGSRKFTGVLRDLTRRADLEAALGASEARWRAVVDSAVDGIVVIDTHGRIEAFNGAAERLFGYSLADVLGQNVAMLMPSPHHEGHDFFLSRYLATGQAKVIGVGRDVQGRRKDGTVFPLHLSVGEFTIQGERKFTGILHDLTERLRMEDRLREQQALATLGEMAAVIAHEVKNPLAGIRGAMQVFGGRLGRDAAGLRIVDEIIARVDALDLLMRDLLLFARPPTPKRTPLDLVPWIRSMVNLMKKDPVLRDVRIDVTGAAPPVPVDPNMLMVVFQNVLINGAHAMDGKGAIHVVVNAADATCRIRVADHGPGIPPDVRERVFVPFFTTKSNGSGLGLPTVKRFVEAHDGSVGITCPPHGGTTVEITLPFPPADH